MRPIRRGGVVFERPRYATPRYCQRFTFTAPSGDRRRRVYAVRRRRYFWRQKKKLRLRRIGGPRRRGDASGGTARQWVVEQVDRSSAGG